MKKIGNILLSIITAGFAVLFIWIIINSIFLGENVIFSYNPIFILIFTLIDIVTMIIFYKKVIPRITKYRYLPFILFVLFGIVTIVISYNLRVEPTWDMGRVFNIAKEYVETGKITDVYLYEYQNNLAITYIFTIIFKIFKKLNFTNYITGITVINALIVTLTVICTYFTVKKIYGKEKGLMLLIICIFTTPLYLYATIYYTDTMSMLFCILILLLYVLLRDEKNKIKNIILQIMFGVILGVGFQIKVTATFIIIAILVEQILNFKFKNIFNNFKIAIPTAVLFLVVFNAFSNNYVIPDKQILNSCKMPMQYWLLIGSTGNGGFNQELYEHVKGYGTFEERKNAATEKFIETIKKYTLPTFLEHINIKLKFTWSDGTYFAPEKLRREPVEKGVLFEYFAAGGEKTEYYKYIPQIMHMSMLVLMVVVAINTLRKRKFESDDVFLVISVLGIAVFLMFWENRSRYLLTLLPIMLILKVRGLHILSNVVNKNKFLKLNKGEVENGK